MARPGFAQWLWMEIYRGLQSQQESSGGQSHLQVSCWAQHWIWLRGRIIGRQPLLLIGEVFSEELRREIWSVLQRLPLYREKNGLWLLQIITLGYVGYI